MKISAREVLLVKAFNKNFSQADVFYKIFTSEITNLLFVLSDNDFIVDNY